MIEVIVPYCSISLWLSGYLQFSQLVKYIKVLPCVYLSDRNGGEQIFKLSKWASFSKLHVMVLPERLSQRYCPFLIDRFEGLVQRNQLTAVPYSPPRKKTLTKWWRQRARYLHLALLCTSNTIQPVVAPFSQNTAKTKLMI